jgi:uncharacterized protein (DUF58 family)
VKRRYHFHLPGVIFIAALALVIAAAMNSQNNLLFWIGGMVFAALAISAFVSGRAFAKLELRRIDPRHGTVGEPLVIGYAVTNRSRLLSVFNIVIEERPVGGAKGWSRLMKPSRAWVMHVGPRETVHGEAVFWPTKRGEARLDRIRVVTTFPFGIIKKSVTVSRAQHTLVYPMLWELRRELLDVISPSGPGGMMLSQRAGPGDEYFGMREYRYGDSFRQVSWKRSAALDTLITIERTEPIPPRLRIALDLTTPTDSLRTDAPGREARRKLEEDAISLAASLVRLAETNGYEVGLSVLGLRVAGIPLRRSQWHVHKIMATLASLDLDGARFAEERGSIPQAERAGLVVIQPDRAEPLGNREDAMYLTAGQLASLALHPVGRALASETGEQAAAAAPIAAARRTSARRITPAEAAGAAA